MSTESIDTMPPPVRVASRRRNWLRLFRSPTAVIGLALILFWVMLAVLAPVLPLVSPTNQDVMAMADPNPSAAHLLGTDILGRDILSRLIFGARTVLVVAPLSVAVAMIVGIVIGMLAGYFGGLVDMLVSRMSDVILAFPVLILYVILIANIGPSVLNIIVATTIASAPGIGRIVRGLVLDLKEREYVAAARLRAESTLYIMIVELLPNCRGPLIVDACLRIGYTIITIGILGFLGLGLPPPNPDWGGMVRETTTVINVWPLMSIAPSIAIVSLVLGFNLLADGMREAWKP
ncbi:ABC transporter permease [Labrys monachus]|uniref:Peptide/nickel transport system permease protein n=1 Tax=Labrys monachus TaxID=217067 RepID=A0ABU0F9G9_9HYPH|nr:ABC transporter permease [Labrys monachus]MDQ0391254.1 peptide/nickel transport system permease protein [Labrys monachus]